MIRLVSGGTPAKLRRALFKCAFFASYPLAPRVLIANVPAVASSLTNQQIASDIAAHMPASTIHVCDTGAVAYASGPNL